MSSRVRLNINRDWRFFRGDIDGAERVDFDDSSWQQIGLPHCFDLPCFRTPEFYVGYGWYRKRIELDENLTPSPRTRGEGRGEGSTRSSANSSTHPMNVSTPLPYPLPGVPGRGSCASLEFDGVFQVAEVFVNGIPAGDHRGGYTGFSIDITDFIRAGENLLAVRVNNNWDPQLSPRAGEHIFSGGIYRDVHLVVTDAVHVGWRGAFVTTPVVTAASAQARISTEIVNSHHQPAECTLEILILDPDYDCISSLQSTRTLAPNSTNVFEQRCDPIAEPMLWHPDRPFLYSARLRVFVADQLVDEYAVPFGFRWFEWTRDRGFFLNGEHLYLRGANAHQDHAGWGIGVTRVAVERDVKLIKEAGFNFVRGSHYPHHPAFADACDRHGLLFMPENCFWGKGGFGPEGYWNASAYPVDEQDFGPFEEHCKQTLREMIRINRNHPSIIAWSMCNEPFFTYNLDRAKNLLRDLVKLTHELDPTRPAAIGGAQRGEIDHIGDIACYNGDGARLFIDPGVPNMVSEYGAIHKPPDAFEPFFGELQQDRFEWRSGEAIWCGFDYGTIAGKQGLKGIIDHARLPKRSWHWYRKENLGIDPPAAPTEGIASRLRLSAEKTTIQGTDASDDCQLILTVCGADGNHISNSPPVTLTIESGPGEFPTGRSITFDESTNIKITLGQAAIAFRSYHGGNTMIRATSPGLRDETITITTVGDPSWASAGSPSAPSRPYVPPGPSEMSIRALKNHVNVALNRPCGASSESNNHPARFANDGAIDTSWYADEPLARWWVDLEGFYQLANVKLRFAAEGNMRYLVETSDDYDQWRVVVDRRLTDSTRAERNELFPPGTIARYVRVKFVHVPFGWRANLCELEVYGILSVR